MLLLANLARSQSIEPRPLIARPPANDGTAIATGSGAATMTSDAVSTLFLSASPFLVTNAIAGPGINVFLRNNTAQTLTLVSASTNGWTGNGVSQDPVISGGRKHIAFASDASNLAANDTNGLSDVFLRALDTSSTRLVSLTPEGRSGNGASSDPAVSSDGRWVAFTSAASDLVAGDTNGVDDVFVRDMTSGVTVLASAGAAGNPGNGPSTSPKLSTDGRYVAFLSRATNLAAGATNALGDIFVRDLTTGSVIWAGRNLQTVLNGLGNPAERRVACESPVLSDNGRYVAFKAVTYAGWMLVLRHDTTSFVTDVVCTNAVGSRTAPGLGGGPSMNTSGRYIAYTARTNATGRMQVWSWDANTKTAANASLNASGAAPAAGDSSMPFISSGGRFVAFLSTAALTADSVSNRVEMYVRDRTTLTTKSANSASYAHLRGDAQPTVNADGRYACFEGMPIAGLAEGVFLMDFTAGSATWITESHPAATTTSAPGDCSVERGGISADGNLVALETTADGLVATDNNGLQDVFLQDLATGALTLVSATSDGTSSGNGWSGAPVISAGGHYIAFTSFATNLVGGDVNKSTDVFVRDMAAGQTRLASVHRSGAGTGNRESWAPSLSGDGRWVAFLSYATNLTTTALTGTLPNAFLRDLASASTVALTTAGTDVPPEVGSDGAHVAFLGGSTASRVLLVRDTAAGTNANLGSYTLGTPFSLSPNGRFLAGRRSAGITVWDLQGKTQNLLSLPSSDVAAVLRQPVRVSNDGRHIAFVSRNLAGSSRAYPDVYLHDFTTSTTTLASTTPDGALPNSGSDSPALSADGRWLLFQSTAWDLILGDHNGAQDVFLFDRLVGKVHLASRRWGGTEPGGARSAGGMLSPDGSRLLFKTAAMDLATSDRSPYSEVFVASPPRNATTDTDGDGMEDSWERAYFGTLERTGGGDYDQDGMTDLEELLAGTSPVDPASTFALRAEVSADGSVALSWPGILGRGYLVQFKDNLSDPAWAPLPGTVSVAGGVATLVDSNPAPGGHRFYRVRLAL
jgi:Tol biopolymer transport system component